MAAILLATGVVVEAVLIRLGQTYGSTPEDDLIVREREHRIEVAAVEDLVHKEGQIQILPGHAPGAVSRKPQVTASHA